MVTDATLDDVPDIAVLAASRREAYEAEQPQFWRRSADAVAQHLPWLRAQVEDPGVLVLVARARDGLAGVIIASVADAPPVYDPGGLTAIVDDFTVADASLWPTIGRDLLTNAKQRLHERGIAQIVVVCGHHDQDKRSQLLAAGLAIASEWIVGPVAP